MARDGVAPLRRGLLEVEQGGALQPAHGEQPPGGERGFDRRHVDAGLALEHLVIEGHVTGLALVVELLAQPCCDLGVDLAGVDRPVVAGIDREDQLELADVGSDRRRHVGVLQLAGERRAVVRRGAVHLAEGGGGDRLRLECCEGVAPAGAELGGHAPLDEAPAHRRRLRLEDAELRRVLVGQAAGDRREQLRDLHQRPLETAERAPELGGVPLAVGGQAEIALARHARGNPADLGADPRIAAHPPAQPVALPIRHDLRLVLALSSAVGGSRSATQSPRLRLVVTIVHSDPHRQGCRAPQCGGARRWTRRGRLCRDCRSVAPQRSEIVECWKSSSAIR